MSDLPPRPSEIGAPRWKPLPAIDRRVLGVLVEKAKTTPDVYPLSINALRSGANQKNNRYPLMELEEDDIADSLERLKALGAVTEVQGSSRVARFRHQMYEWMGVDKTELSVMAELLLRGAQTEGELRGRVSRMDNIPDLGALRNLLDALKSKKLIVSLSSEGRGHVVTHALYEPRELEKLRAEHGGDATAAATEGRTAQLSETTPVQRAPSNVPAAAASHAQAPIATAQDDTSRQEIQLLRADVNELRSQVEQLRRDLDDLWSNFR
jgi:uncharacterized protein YceH (UPF0502 family)